MINTKNERQATVFWELSLREGKQSSRTYLTPKAYLNIYHAILTVFTYLVFTSLK